MDTRREFETWIEDNPGYDESALAAEFCASRKWDDIGLAERLEARFAPVLRYGSGGWIAYNGKSWERNARDTAVAFGKQSARAIADEADYLGDEATREKHAGFAKKACGKAAIDNALTLAQPALKIDDSEFDRSAELLNAPNGTINLRTGELRPHDPADLLTGITAAEYDPAAPRENFDRFLAAICRDANGRDDPAKARAFQVAFGYSLLGDNREHLLFFITGDERYEDRNGRNGKTALFNAIAAALGDGYATSFQNKMICRIGGKAPDPVDRVPLMGARISVGAELNASDILDTGTMKAITGERRTFARYLHQNAVSIATTATPWICSNYLPRFSSTEGAVWERTRRIRLLNYFYAANGPRPAGHCEPQDPDLARKLEAEASGILAWLVEGARAYLADGLPDYAEWRDSLADTRADADPVADFVADCLTSEDGKRITAAELYQVYGRWCAQNALEPLPSRTFATAITAKGIEAAKVAGTACRVGVRFTLVGHAIRSGDTTDSAMDFEVVKLDESASNILMSGGGLDDPRVAAFIQTAKPAKPGGLFAGDIIHAAQLPQKVIRAFPEAPECGDWTLDDDLNAIVIIRKARPEQAPTYDNVRPLRRAG